jgi:hypothetical protein
VVDKLAQDYAGQPVVFLEYYVNADFSTRSSRWWAAFGGQYASLPMVMVDSGNQYNMGYLDFAVVYKSMVDTSMLRPPQAELEAYAYRDGSSVGFYVQVQNLSGVMLSPANDATVHAIVYEDIHVGATDRYVRAAVAAPITGLAPGGTATFTLQTSALEGVNWDKLHYIVLVDYIPDGATAYDMLQASVAAPIPAPFDIDPGSVSFCLEPDHSQDASLPLDLTGAGFLEWSVQSPVAWLTVNPAGGIISTSPILSVLASQLSPGVQQAVLPFTTVDGYFTRDVAVKVFVGECKSSYIPFVRR